MGVETDYIMSDGSDLRAIFESSNPAEEFSGVYGKGSDPFSISALYCALTDQENDKDKADQYQSVLDDGEGRMLLSVPIEVQQCLAGVSEENVDGVLRKWADTEEFMFTGWDDETARQFLLDIGESIRANTGQSLYMWICV